MTIPHAAALDQLASALLLQPLWTRVVPSTSNRYKCIPHADAISTPSQQSKQYSSTTTADGANDAATESADAASHDAFDWQDLDKLSRFRTVQ